LGRTENPLCGRKPEIQISLNNSFNQTVNALSITISPEGAKRIPIKERKSDDESEYYAGEFNDSDLNALADAGAFYLNESAFFFANSKGHATAGRDGQRSLGRRLV
jgi:hypothetical protein